MAAFNYGLKADNDPMNTSVGITFGLEVNPVSAIPKQSSAEKVGDTWLTLEELRIVMEQFAEATNVGPLMQHLIRFCVYVGGQRPFEMIASQWSAIDWQQKTLVVIADVSKNKRAFHTLTRQLPSGGVQSRCHQPGVDDSVRARQRLPVLRHSGPERLPAGAGQPYPQPDGASRCGWLQSGQYHQHSGSGGRGMIPANLSLVPFSPERRAAMEAIAEVERRRSRGAVSTMYPYASAFFRRLTGSTRISLREIHHFAPVLTVGELRGSRDSWLSAINALIESRGTCCWLPLPVGAGQRLFPEVAFQQTERVRCQDALRDEKYTRQRHKERCQRERAYKALAGQAEIELAFQTPETVSSWSARWSGSELRQYDLEEMFWRWSERFPSLSGLEHWMFEGEHFWKVMAETNALAWENPESVRQLERWMVPNKLTARGRT